MITIKTKVLIIILIIVINVMFFNINIVQASGISDVFSGGDDFLSTSKNVNNRVSIDESQLKSTSTMIYNILLILGMCVAVIVAAILGIKFMIGSMEEQAKVKEALIPFVIGCIVVFGAFGIWKIFINIGSDLSSTSDTYEEESLDSPSLDNPHGSWWWW